jgi:hypothetical protein
MCFSKFLAGKHLKLVIIPESGTIFQQISAPFGGLKMGNRIVVLSFLCALAAQDKSEGD